MKMRLTKEVREGRSVTIVRRPKTPEEQRREEVMQRLEALERRIEALEQRP